MITNDDIVVPRKVFSKLVRQLDETTRNYQWYQRRTMELLKELKLMPVSDYKKRGLVLATFTCDRLAYNSTTKEHYFEECANLPRDKKTGKLLYEHGHDYWVPLATVRTHQYWRIKSYE